MFKESTTSLTERTLKHLESPESLTAETISGNLFGTTLVVPGFNGKVHRLHHGFSCLTDQGFSIAFMQGNYQESSICKLINRDQLVAQITTTVGKKTTTTNCPTIDAILGTRDAEEFSTLNENGNQIIRKCPHHCLILPTIFLASNWSGTMKARDLAYQIIDRVRINEDDDETTEEMKDEFADGVELLLCFLRAIDKGKVLGVNLLDVPDTPRINQIIRETKGKSDPITTATNGDVYADNAEAWAISSQSIVQELNRMHSSREEEKSKKEERASLLKNMGPTQRKLFVFLSTETIGTEPSLSEFMKNLMSAKIPQKAIGLLKAETRDWEGTFSDGCVHRFLLSNGFLSLDGNRAHPRGFTVFMFHPRTVSMGNKTFD